MKPTFTKKIPWNWFHEKYDWCKLLHSGTDAENGSYIYSSKHYIPASRLKSASTSTKLFASVRIKRPHKPQLTVNNLELPGIDTKVAASTKKNFWKINVQQFFPINLSMNNIIILSIYANDICIISSSIIVRWVR